MLHYVSVANYVHGQVETTRAMSSFSMPGQHHLLIPRLLANMDTVCWGKATIAREPSNEHDQYMLAVVSNNKHDPYALTVLKNVEGGAAGGYGCATCLCTVKQWPPFVAVASTVRGGGVLEAIPALKEARIEDSIVELCKYTTRTRVKQSREACLQSILNQEKSTYVPLVVTYHPIDYLSI